THRQAGGCPCRLKSDFLSIASVRRLAALAAEQAGVVRHVRLSLPRILWTVLDGPGGSILILANCRNGNADKVRVEVALPARPSSVELGGGEPVSFDWTAGWATLELDLPKDGGAILMFRW
ncbi:MAG TPA: hypothetical protein PK082_09390, partial [Phycisphaerae bacterium]|nr:hypothetical protein [Phycisphaerae bacterium]